MSDDEEAGQLRIDEDSPGPFDEKPVFTIPSPSSYEEPKRVDEPREKLLKEDGELEEEEDEPMDTTETVKTPVEVEPEKEPEKEPTPELPIPEPSKKSGENGMKPPQSTEKTPSRKRKESMDNYGEKRKSGLETISASSSASPSSSSTPQRSKRASSHMATVAISQCFTEEDYVTVPMMPIQRTPAETTPNSKRAKVSNANGPGNSSNSTTTSANNNNHVEQHDISTNVFTTKGIDTSNLVTNESILDAPPGSQLLLEVTVMYQTRGSIAFRLNGLDLVGFINDGMPPMAGAGGGGGSTSTNKKKSNTAEEAKDGRSSSASSNGRSARGESREPSSSKEKGKKDQKRKKEELIEKEEDADDDPQPEFHGSRECQLREIETNEMHDCHFDGCHKRFHTHQQLEYHITKSHQKRVLNYESNCTQTDIIEYKETGTDPDDELSPQPQMPVLKKEEPMKGGDQIVYEDLSDDDQEPKILEQNQLAPSLAPTPSATAALMGIVQASGSGTPLPATQPVVRSTTSTPLSSKIGIHPTMLAQANAQKAEKNLRLAGGPPAPLSVSVPSSSAQPPPGVIQAHPMQQFMHPPFHPSMLHHPQMAAMALDPRVTAALSQQQQMSRTPSRQMTTADSHKIHELAKAKENERQRQETPKTSTAPGTPQQQRQFLPPHLLQTPGTPQTIQQQHQVAMAAQAHVYAAQQAQAQQFMNMQLIAQQQAQQQARALQTQPGQPDLVAAMIAALNQSTMQLPPGAFPGGPPPQQPPK